MSHPLGFDLGQGVGHLFSAGSDQPVYVGHTGLRFLFARVVGDRCSSFPTSCGNLSKDVFATSVLIQVNVADLLACDQRATGLQE